MAKNTLLESLNPDNAVPPPKKTEPVQQGRPKRSTKAVNLDDQEDLDLLAALTLSRGESEIIGYNSGIEENKQIKAERKSALTNTIEDRGPIPWLTVSKIMKTPLLLSTWVCFICGFFVSIISKTSYIKTF